MKIRSSNGIWYPGSPVVKLLTVVKRDPLISVLKVDGLEECVVIIKLECVGGRQYVGLVVEHLG